MSFGPRVSTRQNTQSRDTPPEGPANPFKAIEDAANFLQSEGYVEITRRASEFDLALMIEQVGVAISDIRDAKSQMKALYAIAFCLRTKTHASIVASLSRMLDKDNTAQGDEERRENVELRETRELVAKLAETTEKAAKDTTEAIQKLTESMNTTVEQLAMRPHPPPIQAPPPAATYASAARSNIPENNMPGNGPTNPPRLTTPSANHDRPSPAPQMLPNPTDARPPPQLARRHVARCQVLIDWNSDTAAGRGPPVHNEEEWVEIAAQAMEALPWEEERTEEKPQALVKAINKLRNGGIVIELSSEMHAQQIRDHPDAFCHALPGNSWGIKERLWSCRVKFVPVSFDFAGREALQKITVDSGLPEGSLVSAKWMKNPERRHNNQRVAHLILKFRSAEAANHAIHNDVLIAGKRLQADILDPEPLRCLNCQASGPRCTNCQVNGHASWDRNCPQFQRRAERIRSQRPSSAYKYYVTNEQWTWQTLWDDATRARRPHPPPQPDRPAPTRARPAPAPAPAPARPAPLPPVVQQQMRPVYPAPIPHSRGQNIYSTTQRRREFITGHDFIRMGESSTRPAHPLRRSPASGSNAIPRSTTQRIAYRRTTREQGRSTQTALDEFGFTNPLSPRAPAPVFRPPEDNRDEDDTQQAAITIWQQNLRKSNTATQHFINLANPGRFDVLAVQEPYFDFRGTTRSSNRFINVFPTNHTMPDTPRTRSMLMINAKLSPNSWTELEVPSNDVTAVLFRHRHHTPVVIINVYVDCTNDDSLHHVAQVLATIRLLRPRPEVILLGDFNRHHPMWDDDSNTQLFTSQNLEAAQVLIDLIDEADMEMALPKGIATIENSRGTQTRPDNVFMTSAILDSLTCCQVEHELWPTVADHFPIVTTVSFPVAMSRDRTWPNYKMADWEKLRESLHQNLPEPSPINTIEDFDRALGSFTSAVHQAIRVAVPDAKPSPYSKPWWNPDLKAARKALQGVARRAHRMRSQPDHPIHAVYRRQRNAFGRQIKEAKSSSWNEYLKNIDERNVWSAHRFVSREHSDGSKPRIPTLKSKAPDGSVVSHTSNEEKAKLLLATFFPTPAITAETATQPITSTAAPDVIPQITITEVQVRRAIAKLKPRKATGPDGIPNVVLIKCVHILVAWLTLLFNAPFRLRYMPRIWINTNTMPPKKPGKSDYSVAKSYRPVEIAANLRRLLGAIISLVMSYVAEERRLLPANQFGARPGRSTSDALHLMVHRVKEAWRRRHVMAALFLDVKGAFNSVNIIVLTRELIKSGYPPVIAEWYKMQTGRHTTLSFDDFTSEPHLVETGVGQGVADSGNAYIAYQASLLKIPKEEEGESAIGFVDDVCIMAEGETPREANKKLIHIMTRPDGILEWAKSHDCEFELSKSAHMLWSRKKEHHPLATPFAPRHLLIGNTPIPTVRSQRVLGVIVDDQLSFKEHGSRALAVGTSWLSAFRRLSSVFNGIPPKFARRFYLAVAIPRILYGASVFLQPPGGPVQGSTGLINKLSRVQRQAALLITGAMKTTADEVVNALADLPPFPFLVRQVLYRETMRLATLPPTNPIYRLIRHSPFPITHKSPLHILPRFFDIRPTLMEQSPPFLQAPDWIPTWNTIIDNDQEEAIKHANNISTPIKIFSDGSVIANKVGSACVMYSGGDFIFECRTHMGSSLFHTIFDAELLGIVTALDAYIKKGLEQNVTIGVDSQAAIRALERTGRGPAARIVALAQRQLSDLADKGIEASIQWVPGHVGVAGNERVDKAAKEAAQDTSLSSDHLPPSLRTLPRSAAAHGEYERSLTRNMIARSYFESSRSHIIRITDPTIPSRRFMRITQFLSRTQAAILAQLITGHIGLNYHLHRIGIHHTPACPRCGHYRETPYHLLIECPAYDVFRTDLRKKLKRRASDLTTLVTHTKTHALLFRFLRNTGRFPKLDWTPLASR